MSDHGEETLRRVYVLRDDLYERIKYGLKYIHLFVWFWPNLSADEPEIKHVVVANVNDDPIKKAACIHHFQANTRVTTEDLFHICKEFTTHKLIPTKLKDVPRGVSKFADFLTTHKLFRTDSYIYRLLLVSLKRIPPATYPSELI